MNLGKFFAILVEIISYYCISFEEFEKYPNVIKFNDTSNNVQKYMLPENSMYFQS